MTLLEKFGFNLATKQLAQIFHFTFSTTTSKVSIRDKDKKLGIDKNT